MLTEKMTQLQIAQNILQTCFWNNTNYTAEYILDHIKDKNFAKKIFSAILENSTSMSLDLSILPQEFIVEFLLELKDKDFSFNPVRMRMRLDALINAYIDSSYQLRDRRWN